MLRELINGTLKIFKAVSFHASLSSLFCWSLVKTGKGRGRDGARGAFLAAEFKGCWGDWHGAWRGYRWAAVRSDGQIMPLRPSARWEGTGVPLRPVLLCSSPRLPSQCWLRFSDTAAWSVSYHTHILWLMFILNSVRNDLLWKFRVKQPCLCILHVKSSSSFHVLYLFAGFEPHK